MSMMAQRTNYSVIRHKGKPVLAENGIPRGFVGFCPGDAFGNTGKEDVDRFLAAGVRDFLLWVGRDEEARDFSTTPFWTGVDTLGEPIFQSPDRFHSLPERALYIIERCPEARFVVRFYAHAPKAWREAHPEELVLDEDGKSLPEASLGSQVFAEAVRKFMVHTIRWIEAQQWASRVAGYISLMDFEGTTLNAIEGKLFDYSEPMQKAFRAHAPHREGVPPAAPNRDNQRYPHWLDPGDSGWEREYFLFVTQLFHSRCRLFLDSAREALNGRKVLLGMDALKQGMQGWICEPFFAGKKPRPHHSHILLASGSLHADELLQEQDLSVLNTPYDYVFRHMGGAPEPEGLADSCVLRGKLFLGEDDSRSFAASENQSYGYFRNIREAQAGIWRNVASAMTRGHDRYWMDVTGFPSPRGGYFRDEGIMHVIRDAAAVMRDGLEWDHADIPGIAMIIDDAAALHENFSSDFQKLAVHWQRLVGLAQAGVPYRVYLWEDLLLPNFPDHRVFYFPNLFQVTEEKWRTLQERVLGCGRVVCWGPGTGITDGNRLSTEGATRVTGMEMVLLKENYSRRVLATTGNHPITASWAGGSVYGDSTCYGPILLPTGDQPGTTEQGTVLTSRGVNFPGLAIREMSGPLGPWTSLFTAAVPMPAELFRGMARHAGAHVYSSGGDVILASRNLLAIHAVRSGSREIRLPEKRSVWDLIGQRLIAEDTDTITLEINPPETRFFRLI